MNWLGGYLVATSVLAGIGWVVQFVVYPGFALVGAARWPEYHAAHLRGITRAVVVPWVAQGSATVGLLVVPPNGDRGTAVALAALALAAVVLTVAGAVPAHERLGAAADGGGPHLVTLMRVNLVRSLVWSAAALLSAALLA